MLILTRKPGENIVLDGNIVVRVLGFRGDGVELALDVPDDVSVCWQQHGAFDPRPLFAPTTADSNAGAADSAEESDDLTEGLDDYALECSDPEAHERWQRYVADRGWLLDVDD